jgi:hypothetical protein
MAWWRWSDTDSLLTLWLAACSIVIACLMLMAFCLLDSDGLLNIDGLLDGLMVSAYFLDGLMPYPYIELDHWG